ncbi:MAG: hypothetical protein IPM16_09345 [Chloroflexi bacterium]|nr:hypothetical protein [Chloroflexota bacterium]
MSETRVDADVEVRIDTRVRLMGALLAMTQYPESVQHVRPHGVHVFARNTRRTLGDMSGDPTVVQVQQLLDDGITLETLFALSMHLHPTTFELVRPLPGWVPSNLATNIRDFNKRTKLSLWFEKERAAWEKAEQESRNVFASVQFRPLLSQFFDNVPTRFVFVPTLLYPSDRDVTVLFDGELICIAPPPLAWGDNPPWAYDDPAMLSYSLFNALGGYGKLLLDRELEANPGAIEEAADQALPVNEQFRAAFPTWKGQFRELFAYALTALYLEDYVSDREYRAFVLIEQRMRGMNILPGTVNVMRRYMKERGNKYATIADWIRVFPIQLRLAKRFVSL